MSLKPMLVLPAVLAALIANRAMAQDAGAPLEPYSGPAPIAAMFSGDAALKLAFGEVCLRGVMEQRDYGELALYHHIYPVDPKFAGAGPEDRAWRVASMATVYVVAWKDGSCSTSYQRGNPEALAASALEVATARGAGGPLSQREEVNGGNGERRTYCSAGNNPVVTALTVKVDPRARRPALVTTSFRSKASRPSFCAPGRAAAG